jgi:hypothetical protein
MAARKTPGSKKLSLMIRGYAAQSLLANHFLQCLCRLQSEFVRLTTSAADVCKRKPELKKMDNAGLAVVEPALVLKAIETLQY